MVSLHSDMVSLHSEMVSLHSEMVSLHAEMMSLHTETVSLHDGELARRVSESDARAGSVNSSLNRQQCPRFPSSSVASSTRFPFKATVAVGSSIIISSCPRFCRDGAEFPSVTEAVSHLPTVQLCRPRHLCVSGSVTKLLQRQSFFVGFAFPLHQ